VFEQLRNCSQAQLILKKTVAACWKNFIFSKPKTCPCPKHTGSTVANHTKNTPNVRNSFSCRYWCSVQDPCRDVFEAGGSTGFCGITPKVYEEVEVLQNNFQICSLNVPVLKLSL